MRKLRFRQITFSHQRSHSWEVTSLEVRSQPDTLCSLPSTFIISCDSPLFTSEATGTQRYHHFFWELLGVKPMIWTGDVNTCASEDLQPWNLSFHECHPGLSASPALSHLGTFYLCFPPGSTEKTILDLMRILVPAMYRIFAEPFCMALASSCIRCSHQVDLLGLWWDWFSDTMMTRNQSPVSGGWVCSTDRGTWPARGCNWDWASCCLQNSRLLCLVLFCRARHPDSFQMQQWSNCCICSLQWVNQNRLPSVGNWSRGRKGAILQLLQLHPASLGMEGWISWHVCNLLSFTLA